MSYSFGHQALTWLYRVELENVTGMHKDQPVHRCRAWCCTYASIFSPAAGSPTGLMNWPFLVTRHDIVTWLGRSELEELRAPKDWLEAARM